MPVVQIAATPREERDMPDFYPDVNVIRRIKVKLREDLEHQRKVFQDHAREFEEAIDEFAHEILNRRERSDPKPPGASA